MDGDADGGVVGKAWLEFGLVHGGSWAVVLVEVEGRAGVEGLAGVEFIVRQGGRGGEDLCGGGGGF